MLHMLSIMPHIRGFLKDGCLFASEKNYNNKLQRCFSVASTISKNDPMWFLMMIEADMRIFEKPSVSLVIELGKGNSACNGFKSYASISANLLEEPVSLIASPNIAFPKNIHDVLCDFKGASLNKNLLLELKQEYERFPNWELNLGSYYFDEKGTYFIPDELRTKTEKI
jgi:hypothetical protein